MRILIANEARQGAGGVETYLSSLVPQLEARGHAVALLYANPSTETGPTRVVTNDGWSVADLGIDRAVAAVRAWHPDICFSHNMRRLDVDERLAAAWPTFKMMHGYFGACVSGHKAFSVPAVKPCDRACGPGCLAYYFPRNCGQLRPGVMIEQYGWARRQQRLFPKYAGIVVASQHMRREYLRYGLSPDGVHAIPLFTAPPVRVSQRADDPIDVVFLGRLTPLKGAAALVDALPDVARALGRRVTAVMAGAGPERERLQQRIRSVASGGMVTIDLPGWVEAPARSALFSRASLVVIPSLWPEPFGLVGLEAAHYGVPAVAFEVGGISEWLAHDVNGCLVDRRSGPAGLATAIAAVLGDPVMRARLSAGALAAAQRFSPEDYVARLEGVMGELAVPVTSAEPE